ncbi:DUF262 domain-containing protein [Sinisalibacter lacisalsi]|uniref:GmrSD restriction endonucleases N-terminal domain-containing protein n=1 Tax=Sinisalibacter lacisalsi TaxID=1526570 RepID=A0ABQ1QQQ6_9RHOB|nr:DUF262 domain-containing protein [Sinisalibacter lacisalsi]GGD38943.1 hypothetical protein GCM10011358_23570 [Sinisalibacter lacisalsi]
MSQEITNDWDVEKTEEGYNEEDSIPLKFEILNYPADTTLKGYRQQSEDGLLEVPTFQRNFVWDQVKASKLIESFLIGLPVPGVFLYKPRSGTGYQVIDGHQRITSVVSYLKGLIGEKKFRLKGVSDHWNNKSFDELSEEDQFKLEQSVMRATIIQQLDPQDNKSIYMIFERLNTGGMNLNPMEVRRCVYHGSFISALDEMNAMPSWRKCLGKASLDKRFRDVELVLRVLALSQSWQEYEKPMKGFLSDFLADSRDNDGEGWKIAFGAACDAVLAAKPDRPFHLRGKLNYGALDAVLCALIDLKTKPTPEQIEALFKDAEFAAATTANTSDRSEVHKRIEKAIEYLS